MSSDPGSILIVDDNSRNIQVVASILKQDGHSITIAMNGQNALECLRNTPIDLVLLDVTMPGMDGFEVCERIKADPHTQSIPVIFLTARSDLEDLVKGFEVGGIDYVCKPFRSVELLARVRTHVSLHKARHEIQHLRGILPICASCRKIRNDDGYWQQVEVYFAKRTDLSFSHGICEDCARKLYPDIADSLPKPKAPPE